MYVILLPAVTGFGLAELVTLKSATVPAATAIVTVAELFIELESCEVVTESVSVISVPEVVPVGT